MSLYNHLMWDNHSRSAYCRPMKCFGHGTPPFRGPITNGMLSVARRLGQDALTGRRERRNTVHKVELVRGKARLELTPQFEFERVIGERGKCRIRCPAFSNSAPQSLSKLKKGSRHALIVDGCKVAPFDQSRANNRVSIADVRDKMRIDNFRQCAGKTPAHQWYACPFRVRSFGYE